MEVFTAMKFEIRSVKNGVVLRVELDYPDAEVEEIVYQETESADVEAFADFLRFLVDHYGPATSRYSPKRIRILVESGDKYEASPAHQGTDPCLQQRRPSVCS